MKIEKGTFGYIKAQKKKRTLITAGLFLIPIVIFLTGLHETGTRLNMFTFVAIMGCLPASRSAVSMIMMLMQKSTDPEVYRQVEERAGDLVRAYELTISAYEKNTSLDSLVICGYHVAAYSSDPKTDVTFAQNHIKEILKGNGYRADVKIFTDLKHYLDRVSNLEKQREKLEAEISFTPKEGFPDLSRSEMVRETIYAISL
jgi:hypothetical protein